MLQRKVDFDEHDVEKNRILFETLFAEQNPGKILGKDISFDELSKEAQDAYAIYNYEYYRIQFEEAAKSFNIAYAYYLVPTGEPEHMYWFLDIARDGIRNKTAYDKEIRKLEWEFANRETEVGIAMIDLNFLKRNNDTYGHDREILQLSLCANLFVRFSHILRYSELAAMNLL